MREVQPRAQAHGLPREPTFHRGQEIEAKQAQVSARRDQGCTRTEKAGDAIRESHGELLVATLRRLIRL